MGGAANVARNAVAQGAEVSVVFAIGNDDDGMVIQQKLEEWHINCEYLIRSSQLRTINKVRVVGNNQQIVRVDYHDEYRITPKLENSILEHIKEAVLSSDIVVISDYEKGTCTDKICKELIKLAKGKPVIVDPKGVNWEKYRGAFMITPNMKELNLHSGISVDNNSDDIEKIYGNMYEKLGITYLLLTRSECGMSLFGKNTKLHISAETQEVYDVSGAGDTVVATLAATLDIDTENLVNAVKISNIAAGIVVSKPGTAVVTKQEIRNRISENRKGDELENIYTIDKYKKLEEQIKIWREAGEQIITTNGCFDIVHRGHVKLLEEAKKMGNRLVVVLNSDMSVKRLKGQIRPLNSELDRAYILASLKSVDAIVIFDPQKTPYLLTKEEKLQLSDKAIIAASEAPMYVMNLIKSDIHVKGGDYKAEEIPEAIFSKELAFVSFVEGYSTTRIIQKIYN